MQSLTGKPAKAHYISKIIDRLYLGSIVVAEKTQELRNDYKVTAVANIGAGSKGDNGGSLNDGNFSSYCQYKMLDNQ